MQRPSINIQLPDWTESFLDSRPDSYPAPSDRMTLAIDLASENIKQGTGGPFGAAIFDAQGNLISVGINLVTSLNCSVLHAEMVAFMFAQQVLGRFDISNDGNELYELNSSTEPCAMCFGALPWSGAKRLVCGARDADARAIGFDEGPKLKNWQTELENRGIEVIRDVLRDKAIAVLNHYVQLGGPIYNAGKP